MILSELSGLGHSNLTFVRHETVSIRLMGRRLPFLNENVSYLSPVSRLILSVKRILSIIILICWITIPASAKGINLPITSHYGWRQHPITGEYRFHTGIDLGYDHGTVIVSVLDGLVVFAGNYGGYGKTVIVAHKNNRHSLYAHCHRLDVAKGDFIKKGERIGLVGASGNVTGPHLHLEWWIDGKYANPLLLWKGRVTDAGKDSHRSK